MPFNPHTDDQVAAMLDAIGAKTIDDLFDEIPAHLRVQKLEGVPERMNEMQVTRLLHERAAEDGTPLNFIGAGAYEHHIPAAVWQVATRGEFYSAYTPYQAEASQGTLQTIYEFQTMMARLTALDVSNASLYDGASGLAEAVLMAVRGNRKSKSRRILMPRTVHPRYRDVSRAIATTQDLVFEDMPFDAASGVTAADALAAYDGQDITAVVIQQPNFFGRLEDVAQMTDWAHRNGALVIGVANPIALALIAPPGEWGENGADMACGEGQPLGVPLAGGGPYFGYLTCTKALMRQMPGRIVGRTLDLEGKPGFVLTLQAREQHIRRSKATSNICTNQGLAVTAATIHMALLGPSGLSRVAAACMASTDALIKALTAIPGISERFPGHRFHESVLQLPVAPGPVLNELAAEGIAGGYDLARDYPDLGHALLVCATETRTQEDIDRYASAMRAILARSGASK